MRIVWLRGDYVGNHERQQQAKKEGVDIVLSLHFNSASQQANGAEFYFNSKCSQSVIQIGNNFCAFLVARFGIRFRGGKPAKYTRAAFIEFYHCPTLLFEPCFVSNPKEASLLHRPDTIPAMAAQLGRLVFEWCITTLGNSAVIGIDVGHMFKTSNPKDRGALCIGGKSCTEAQHALELAYALEKELLKHIRNIQTE